MTASITAPGELFEPVLLGEIKLANRVVMAPMTRLRANGDGVPGELIAEHYRQRAGTGMIITEGTYPSPESRAYPGQPGIATDAQADGWRRVVDAVHGTGGNIVVQLMHGGRASHPDTNGGRRVLAPSAVAIDGSAHTATGKQPYPVPEAMTAEDIDQTVRDHVAAARRAIDAGADGVEIHGANGYLLQQFLAPGSNTRTDDYGGSPANRARLAIEVVAAVAEAVGAGRVGLRISPQQQKLGTLETDLADVRATYRGLLERIRPLGLAYLSIVHEDPTGELVEEWAELFDGKVILNTGFSTTTTLEEAAELITAPFVDAVVVGRALIANPDLVERWRRGAGENPPRPELFYHHSPEGYTDYPFLGEG